MEKQSEPFQEWSRVTRLQNEEVARRAYRLGARFATVKELFGSALTDSRNKAICDELGMKRISGQPPKSDDALLGAQLRIHLTIFRMFMLNQPEKMPRPWRVVAAYDAYSRVVATIDKNGSPIGQDLERTALARDAEKGRPKLSFDRAEHFTRSGVFSVESKYSMGRCRDCRTPYILQVHESSSTYLCAYCTDRLIAGRPRLKKSAEMEVA